uniref:Family with sequence similarity 13 member A n=1 Tax=Balaenoptera musculus TaxID=9771 RepID=A0A8C0CLJ1_BALMU
AVIDKFHCLIDSAFFFTRLLERTIRSAVEQHLLDVNSSGGQSSEDSESGTSPASFSTSTKQRRRQSEEQDEVRHGSDVGLINKENIPSGFNNLDECILNAHHEAEKLHENTSGYIGERGKPKRQKSSCKLSELSEHQDSLVNMESLNPTPSHERIGPDDVELMSDGSKENENDGRQTQHFEADFVLINIALEVFPCKRPDSYTVTQQMTAIGERCLVFLLSLVFSSE